MRVFFFFALAFICIIPLVGAAITLNEVMYAPSGDWGGQYNEWIELSNNGTTDANVTEWMIDGKEIPEAAVPAGGYLILAKNSTKFFQAYGTSSVQVPFVLSNDGEPLNITANGTLIDIFDYTQYAVSGIAKNNNRTLERNASGWFESAALGGTPGAANSILFPVNPENQNANDNGSAAESQNSANQAQESSPAARLEIMQSPSSMKFGDFGVVHARFLSGNRGFAKMRFVAYVWSPAWIARDMTRDENTLRNAPYNAAAAAEAENIAENTSTNILLPLFLKCNPGNKYAAGSYTARVRGYSFRDGSWSEVSDSDAQIPVSGENELCNAEIVYVNKTIKESCTSAPARNETDALRINITAPGAGIIGKNFTTIVKMENKGNASLDLEVYSYLYEHSTIMSQGWSGEKWGNSRTANARKVALAPNSSETVELLNMPRENISAEKYTYKVRIDDMNDVKKSEERIFLVDVKAPQENEGSELNVKIKNESSDNRITGAMAAEHSENPGLSFWEKLIDRIKSWLEW